MKKRKERNENKDRVIKQVRMVWKKQVKKVMMEKELNSIKVAITELGQRNQAKAKHK